MTITAVLAGCNLAGTERRDAGDASEDDLGVGGEPGPCTPELDLELVRVASPPGTQAHIRKAGCGELDLAGFVIHGVDGGQFFVFPDQVRAPYDHAALVRVGPGLSDGTSYDRQGFDVIFDLCGPDWTGAGQVVLEDGFGIVAIAPTAVGEPESDDPRTGASDDQCPPR